jgi:maltooligosyltrehalose trehalohydrolase
LLRLRREDRVFSAQRADRVEGAVLGAHAFVLRYLGGAGDDRLVLVNLGGELTWSPPAEPLAAPPEGRKWRLLWSSEDTSYGGLGTPPTWEQEWFLPAHAAAVLIAEPE